MLYPASSRTTALLLNWSRRFPVAWLWGLAVATASVAGVRLSGRRRSTPVTADRSCNGAHPLLLRELHEGVIAFSSVPVQEWPASTAALQRPPQTAPRPSAAGRCEATGPPRPGDAVRTATASAAPPPIRWAPPPPAALGGRGAEPGPRAPTPAGKVRRRAACVRREQAGLSRPHQRVSHLLLSAGTRGGDQSATPLTFPTSRQRLRLISTLSWPRLCSSKLEETPPPPFSPSPQPVEATRGPTGTCTSVPLRSACTRWASTILYLPTGCPGPTPPTCPGSLVNPDLKPQDGGATLSACLLSFLWLFPKVLILECKGAVCKL